MGFQREDSEAGSQGSPPLRGSRSIDPEDSQSSSSTGPDPSVLSPEAYATGFNSGLCGRALETRHLTEGPAGTGPIRCPTAIDRQRAYADDLCSNPTIDLAEITIGSGHCSSLDEMRKAILALSLGNGSNICYMNAALLAELWACCMNDTFVWHKVGAWKDPLIGIYTPEYTLRNIYAICPGFCGPRYLSSIYSVGIFLFDLNSD